MSSKNKIAIVLVAFLVGVFSLSGVSNAKTDKVNVCHVTGSEQNPIELISVSSNAVDAHLAHGDSLLLPGHADCGGGGGPFPG